MKKTRCISFHSAPGSIYISLVILFLSGCATTRHHDGSEKLSALSQPAWSYHSSQDRFAVAVSPARQTMQFAGTTGILIGSSISAVANARQRGPIDDLLAGYDAPGFIEKQLESQLLSALQTPATRVEPMPSTAGYQDKRDTEREYYRALGRQNLDGLLKLETTYGIFGPQGVMAARIDGEILTLPSGQSQWQRSFLATSTSLLFGERLNDPTQRLTGDLRSPRLTVADGAIAQWTHDNGEYIKETFEELTSGVICALLTDLELQITPAGYYFLGVQSLYGNDKEEAWALFLKALELTIPNEALWGRTQNAMAFLLWNAGQKDDAYTRLLAILEHDPQHGAAHFNAAYYLSEKRVQLDDAARHYQEALKLGIRRSERIEEALQNAGISLTSDS